MTTNIYWACLEENWMEAEEPTLVRPMFLKNLDEVNNHNANIGLCPAFNSYLKNTYALRSVFNYKFKIENNTVSSLDYDQKFFDNHVIIRSLEKKMFSFINKYIFFTDKDSLITTFYIHPYLEDNYISRSCMILPGDWDIGRWFRNTEFAFILKNNIDTFFIEKNDIYSYIKFNTNDNIKFIQFKYTDKLKEYQEDGSNLISFNKFLKMENFYSLFKTKKLILNEIKRNII